jgi:hypothetical protein
VTEMPVVTWAEAAVGETAWATPKRQRTTSETAARGQLDRRLAFTGPSAVLLEVVPVNADRAQCSQTPPTGPDSSCRRWPSGENQVTR